MNLTKSQLRRIIKEEIQKAIKEEAAPPTKKKELQYRVVTTDEADKLISESKCMSKKDADDLALKCNPDYDCVVEKCVKRNV